jgi:tRNA(Arg) A34 adenosine deaminase TadA
MQDNEYFMQKAINLSLSGMNSDDGGPFGAVIVRDGEVIAQGNNEVTSKNDPT